MVLIKIKKVCFGSDGGSKMVGVHIDVISSFRKNNPFMMNIHCVNHRMSFANQDLTKDISNLEEYIDISHDTYRFFHQSSSRYELLKPYK